MCYIRRCFGILGISVKERLRYRFDFFMSIVSTIGYGVLYFLLWKAIYSYSNNMTMSWTELITYIMVAQAINLTRYSASDRMPVHKTNAYIKNGDIALDLLRPVDFHIRRFLESAGYYIVDLLWINIPVFIVFILFLGIDAPKSIGGGVAFVISLIIGYLLAFGVNSLVMMLAFWTDNSNGIQIAKQAVIGFLAGSMVPYEFFPEWLRVIAQAMPFQGMAHIPLSIYTGKIAGIYIISALLKQLLWAMIMLMISRIVWLFAARRITIYGG